MVDDALIPARYAAHIAAGVGYRFNAAGPVTDGVTPLGWAYLLAPFASGGPLQAFFAAKGIGLLAWVLAAGGLAAAIDRVSDKPARFTALALIVLSAPLAAWSVGGLETGLVTALAATAVSARAFGKDRIGSICAGLAAGFRPELLPWAAVVAASPGVVAASPVVVAAPDDALPGEQEETAPARRSALSAALGRLTLATAPFLAAALIRAAVFGRAAPLSSLAKQADVGLGARYALACFLLTGPIALLAPIAWKRLPAWPRGLLFAVAAHFVAVAVAGGDWMPLSRLVVPVLPTVALAAAHVASVASVPITIVRVLLAVAGLIFVWVRVGPDAARVGADRLALIEELRAPLRDAKVVAALDVGWVGAVTDATLVDLAGVTDPTIAAFPGGHTTRQFPVTLLDSRGVDTIVLLLHADEPVAVPWTESRFDRGVEHRVAWIPDIAADFQPIAVSKRSPLRYLVLRRTRADTAAHDPFAR